MISHALLLTVRTLFNVNDDWRYVLFDKYVTDSSAAFDHGNGIPWKSWQNPTVLSGTRIGYLLKTMVLFASQQSITNSTNDYNERYKNHMTAVVFEEELHNSHPHFRKNSP